MSNVTINALPVASTIDAVNDLLPIFTNSSTSTQAISRNTLLGLASAPVGLTDSQTLTNKILTSPTINTPTVSSPTFSGTIAGTYTIGGTPTFPSSVVTLTGSQTLTNKVLTAPTITNATISADAITGFTTSNSGTVYGIPITLGQFGATTFASLLTAANGFTLSSGTLTLPNNAIAGTALATTAITLGYAQITSNFTTTSTTFVDVTGLTTTVTVPAGGRRVQIEIQATGINNSATGIWNIALVEDGTVIQQWYLNEPTATANNTPLSVQFSKVPTAGSHTYKVQVATTAGTVSISAGTTSGTVLTPGPSSIIVKAV